MGRQCPQGRRRSRRHLERVQRGACPIQGRLLTREVTMKLRVWLLGAAVSLVAVPALAQDKTFNLRLSHWVPATHPLQKAMEEWGASVDKASGGTIKQRHGCHLLHVPTGGKTAGVVARAGPQGDDICCSHEPRQSTE